MEILILSDNYFPEMNANARIFSELAELWAMQNQHVSVITCHPNFPEGKLFEGHKNTWMKKTFFNQVNVIRVKTYMHPNKGFIKRSLDFLSFGFMSFIVGLFQKNTDVIVGVTPQFFAGLSACCLSIVKRKPFVLILCDLWPDSIVANDMMKKGCLYHLIKKIESWMYRKATSIIILSENFRKYLKQQKIPDHKIFTSISGTSQQFYPKEKNISIINKYLLSDKFVIGCIGTFGASHNHEDILSIAKVLKEKRKEHIHFLMIGAGVKKEILLQQKGTYYLDNVTIDGPFPPKTIPEYWSVADLAIVPLAPTETNKTVLPSKMLEIMAMGIPIILYAPTGEAKRFLSLANAGWFINAGDIHALEGLITKLSLDRTSFLDKKINTIKFASCFTREQQAYDLLKYIQKTYKQNTKKVINEKN